MVGLDVQEVAHEGARLNVVRQRVAERTHAGGKQLLKVPGYKFQALRTNLPAQFNALEVWRRYNGRVRMNDSAVMSHIHPDVLCAPGDQLLEISGLGEIFFSVAPSHLTGM